MLIFMSDAGGSGDIAGLNFTLADSAAALLSDAGPLVAGTFRPSERPGERGHLRRPGPHQAV